MVPDDAGTVTPNQDAAVSAGDDNEVTQNASGPSITVRSHSANDGATPRTLTSLMTPPNVRTSPVVNSPTNPSDHSTGSHHSMGASSSHGLSGADSSRSDVSTATECSCRSGVKSYSEAVSVSTPKLQPTSVTLSHGTDQRRANRPSSSSVKTQEDDFTTPRYHRKKNLAMTQSMNIFITKVHKDYTCEELYKYLIDCEVQVRGLYQRSHVNAAHKSFVVSIARSDFSKVDRQELWDEGIEVREYIERNDRRSTQGVRH